MSRYIDADKVMEEIKRIDGLDTGLWDTAGVKALICRQETADVVEVARCKDCKHYHAEKGGWCELHDFEFDCAGYCSDSKEDIPFQEEMWSVLGDMTEAQAKEAVKFFKEKYNWKEV